MKTCIRSKFEEILYLYIHSKSYQFYNRHTISIELKVSSLASNEFFFEKIINHTIQIYLIIFYNIFSLLLLLHCGKTLMKFLLLVICSFHYFS